MTDEKEKPTEAEVDAAAAEMEECIEEALDTLIPFLLPFAEKIAQRAFQPDYAHAQPALEEAMAFPPQRAVLPFIAATAVVEPIRKEFQKYFAQEGDGYVVIEDDGTKHRLDDGEDLASYLVVGIVCNAIDAWMRQLFASMFDHSVPGRIGLTALQIDKEMLPPERGVFYGILAHHELDPAPVLEMLREARKTLGSGEVLPEELADHFLLKTAKTLM